VADAHSHFDQAMTRASPGPIIPCLPFDRRAAGPYYKQIYESYRAAILDGRLRPGQRLPSTRAMARELGISRLPVLNAFDQLLHEGFVKGRVGAGTYVSSSILRETRQPAADRAKHRSDRPAGRPRTPDPDTLLGPFRVSLPALDQFPMKTWSRLVARRARTMSIEAMAYGAAAGHDSLRHAIADYLRTARAVSCEAGDVLIASGSQMALRLCAMALLKRGDEVCAEDPCYPGARRALAATGARVRAVPVDGEGLVVRALPSDGRRARVVYVTPSHQYPLGMSMSAPRRLELLEWARRNEAWIVEDDYDSEFRYASRPLGSLQGMDGASRVIYVGTFSKVLFPSLRVGYLVVPPNLFGAFVDHRESLDIFSATLYQLALSDFLTEGHFARHIRRMRAVYLKRRDALVEAIRRSLPQLTIVNADAGMHLTGWLPPDINDQVVVRRAASRGISAAALSRCYAGKAHRTGLVLGFGGADETAIERAAKTLAQLL
jgi:GntR family transcriptional regulator / MocR family aminotransferase